MRAGSKTDKQVRFGCGFVFGLLLGGFGAALAFYDDGKVVAVAAFAIAVATGLASLYLGDAFWRAMKHWIWWLP